MNRDSNFIQEQTSYLEDLIAFKAHPFDLDDRDKIGWSDWEHGPLAIVTRKDALSVLNRVASGELTIKDYYDWGVSIAGRDTIGYEKGYLEVLTSIVYDIITNYEARNVSVSRPVDDYIRYYLNKLNSAEFDATEDSDDE